MIYRKHNIDACLVNSYADDCMIYASNDNILEVQQKYKSIRYWSKINRLKINIDKTKVMFIGSKAQIKKILLRTLQTESVKTTFI